MKWLASMLPEHDSPVAEELLARLGKTARQLLRVVHVEPQELPFRGPLKADQLQVLVLRDRAADELELESRLPLEVEDLLAAVLDLDELLARVILGDHLSFGDGDLETEYPGAGLGDGEVDAHRRGLRVPGESQVPRV